MPLNWLMLFSFFSLLLITMNMMNYYPSSHKLPSTKSMSKTLTKTMNWKW